MRLGNTDFLISFFRFLHITISRSILMPPAVEPAHDPQSISIIVRNNENCPQFSASEIENPVDVIAETT